MPVYGDYCVMFTLRRKRKCFTRKSNAVMTGEYWKRLWRYLWTFSAKVDLLVYELEFTYHQAPERVAFEPPRNVRWYLDDHYDIFVGYVGTLACYILIEYYIHIDLAANVPDSLCLVILWLLALHILRTRNDTSLVLAMYAMFRDRPFWGHIEND